MFTKHPELQVLWAWAMTTTNKVKDRAGRDKNERGVEVATVVILTAVFAAAAIAIGAIIVQKFTGAANNIPTGG